MNPLQQALEIFSKQIDHQKLRKASLSLSTLYREGNTPSTEEELIAYLIVRLPATYASITRVLSSLSPPQSILDLGAGPGTVSWVAHTLWNALSTVTSIERDPRFIKLGKKLGSPCEWIQGDLLSIEHFSPHEWVVFGYSLGEIPEKNLPSLLSKSWKAAQKGLIIVEPGTPRGTARMLLARDYLIKEGGFVLAPCPHSNPCPLQPPDWCHFSVRLERSSLHRATKLATLPFEDEKFSYVILTKEKPTTSIPRIIRPPLRHPGHTILSLCTPTGIQNTTFSRSQKEPYKRARKSDWGDLFEI